MEDPRIRRFVSRIRGTLQLANAVGLPRALGEACAHSLWWGAVVYFAAQILGAGLRTALYVLAFGSLAILLFRVAIAVRRGRRVMTPGVPGTGPNDSGR